MGDGSRTAFVRVGNESVQAGAIELKRLVLRGSNQTYDSLSSYYPYENYAFTKLRSVYRQRTGKKLEEADFISFGLVDENGMLTNAGVLLADESPMRHSRLFCTRWNGLNKASGVMEALDDKELSSFWVTLYNLNYNVTVEGVDVGNRKQLFAKEKTVVLNEKQLFGDKKTVVSKKKQLFEKKINELRISTLAKEKILRLYEQYSDDMYFSRADVMSEVLY